MAQVVTDRISAVITSCLFFNALNQLKIIFPVDA